MEQALIRFIISSNLVAGGCEIFSTQVDVNIFSTQVGVNIF